MISTTTLTKYATTRGFVLMGSYIDGFKVIEIQHDNDGNTRFKLQGEGWTEWLPSDWHVSYHI